MSRSLSLLLAALALVASCQLYVPPCSPRQTTVASGLTNPRGLARGANGTLYVAEAGTEVTGGRVSRVTSDGRVTTLLTALPHSVNSGVEDVGASGVALRRGEPYVVEGEARGELGEAMFRIDATGAPRKVADFAAFEARVNPDGAEIESNPFALIYDETADVFYATDAAGNSLLRVAPDGTIGLVAVWRDDAVPTGLARGPDGALYVALFGRFPHTRGTGRVDRVAPDGSVQTVAPELTMPIAVGFGSAGEMYVLEFSAALETHPKLGFMPDTGRLLRVRGRERDVVADRLPLPTGLLVERDGGLLVSTHGHLSDVGSGAIVRVEPCSQRR